MYLSNGGYQPNTPEEIRENLNNLYTQNVSNYQQRPADLLSNVLDGNAVALTYNEQQLSILFNAYAPSFAPNFLFELRGAEVGLRRKGSFKSSVEIQFSGDAYSVVPANTGVTGTGLPTYSILEDVAIPSTGSIIVTAYSDDAVIPAVSIGSLNTLTTNLQGITATNTTTPTEPQDEESIEAFRKRVQAVWRSPKGGSYDYLLSTLQAIDGVDTRATTLNFISANQLEVIIAGGTNEDIAFAILKAGGLMPSLFVSQPSQSQTARTVEQEVILNNQSITISFTRALKVNISLKVDLPLTGVTVDNNSIQSLTQEAMTNYINNTKIGEPINISSLSQVFLGALEGSGASANNVNANNITYTVQDITNPSSPQPISFTPQGFLQLQKDWYCVLSSYSVEVNA